MPSPEVRAQIIRFCARRERSQREVLDKIRELQAPSQWLEELQEEGWWNQERFAKAYAFDQWNLHHWGKEKISQGLRAAGVDSGLRQQVLNNLPQEEYLQKLKRLMQRKQQSYAQDITEELRQKSRSHFARKG
jgi:regulatory protein